MTAIIRTSISYTLTLLFISTILMSSVFSQTERRGKRQGESRVSSGRITGIVIDSSSGIPMENATVTLMKKTDSTIIGGSLTKRDGTFQISKVSYGSYLIKINFIGYEAKFIEDVTLNSSQPHLDLGTVKLVPGTVLVEGVEVTADREEFQIGIDKKVFDVEKSLVSQGGSATDVLKNIPSVSVDIDGNVSLRGDPNVTVLINGKPSGLTGSDRSAVLDQIPASSISNVELITNPSAKYDPDGLSGIINIILKENDEDVTNGGVTLTTGTKDKYNASGYLNYSSNKLNVSANYSWRLNSRSANDTDSRENTLSGSPTYLNTIGSSTRKWNSNLGKISLDYNLDKFNSVNLGGMYNYFTNKESELVNYNYLDAVQNSTGFSVRNNGEDNKGHSMDLSLGYKRKFNDPEQKLTADIFYSGSARDNSSTHLQNDFEANGVPSVSNPFLQNTAADISYYIVTLQSDYVHPFSKDTKLQAGYKSVFRHIDNAFTSETLNDTTGQWQSDINLNNEFLYKEQTHAAYATFTSSIKDFSYMAGLRVEKAYTTSQLINTNEQFKNDYLSLFPSVFLLQKFGKDREVQLSYTRRINRPSIRSLNPFTDYDDPLNLRSGNPYLKPEYIDSYELSFANFWKNNIVTSSLFYRKINDMIQRIITVDTNGVSLTTFQNLNNGYSYGFELIAKNTFFDWWKLMTNFNFYREIIKGTVSTQGDLDNSSLNWDIKVISNMTFFQILQLQISGHYESPETLAQGSSDADYFVDAGFRVDFLNKKASVNFNLNDIFNTRRHGSTKSGFGFYEVSSRKHESRIAYLGFTYRFGKETQKKKQNTPQENNENDFEE